ncbi:hypothetical protein TWF703_010730 [Orbilia oligospora]|uniref:Zn(2)-C6 fungal-type domain-containing protein n=1 Tax=Orbilia oligospora TaxID=2813651 RepID=A0A7C8P1F8_ORBOL|nr:hypothetical protein TWF703_010730 [Orbilia oligospora]
MNLQAILTDQTSNSTPISHAGVTLVAPSHPHNMPKHVNFTLITDPAELTSDLSNLPNVKFTINTHDTTESITTAITSFFGLFSNGPTAVSSHRVSFEDENENRIILSYNNVRENQNIFVRPLGEALHITRDSRGTSPNKSRGGSAAMSRSRSNKRHASSTPTPDADLRKQIEPVASAEISVENILEGSRRKRLKFESSATQELPLFPEMTNRFGPPSSSSASPSRPTPQLTPYSQPGHQTAYAHPQSAYLYSLGTEPTPPPSATTNTRVTLPTPAPTIASCISDEDAAIQLMRLGEKPTNNGHSHHHHQFRHQYSPDLDYNGQPTHTLLPSPVSHGYSQHTSPVRVGYSRTLTYEEAEDDVRDGNYVASDDYQDEDDEIPLLHKRSHFAPNRQAPPPPNGVRKKAPSKPKKIKKPTNNLIPAPQLNAFPGYPSADTSFNGLEAATSLANLANPEGKYIQQGVMLPPEPQENQKPRCQRCRKSKKGCDRQRPCQRCKDAGIPADQCISEDEAGTRRGRMNAAKAAAANGIVKPKAPKPKKRKVTPEQI